MLHAFKWTTWIVHNINNVKIVSNVSYCKIKFLISIIMYLIKCVYHLIVYFEYRIKFI